MTNSTIYSISNEIETSEASAVKAVKAVKAPAKKYYIAETENGYVFTNEIVEGIPTTQIDTKLYKSIAEFAEYFQEADFEALLMLQEQLDQLKPIAIEAKIAKEKAERISANETEFYNNQETFIGYIVKKDKVVKARISAINGSQVIYSLYSSDSEKPRNLQTELVNVLNAENAETFFEAQKIKSLDKDQLKKAFLMNFTEADFEEMRAKMMAENSASKSA